MALQPVQFAIATSVGRSTPATSERLVNMFPVLNPPGAKSKVTLLGTPGLLAWNDVGSGTIRGMATMGLFLYVVSGTELYKVNFSGSATLIGTIAGTAPVAMASNGSQMAIVADTITYVATETTLVSVSNVDAIDVTVQDGYAVYVTRNSGQFVLSAINDAASVDPLDFATAESKPDALVGIESVNRELWLFGSVSTEVWYNSGAADFPFARNAAGVINRGCLAGRSITVIDGQIFWLADDGCVYRNAGYVPQRISTHAVEYAIGNYELSDKQAAVGLTYSQEGHTFYALNFADGTWVYDLSTGLWHERQSYGETRWRVGVTTTAFGRLLASDFEGNSIYELKLDTYTEDGTVIQRIIDTEPLGNGSGRATLHAYQVDVEAGVGLVTGQGSDPQIMLQWSDDGGRTWSSQHWAGIGQIGRYKNRTLWRRLGMFRQRTMRLIMSDPVKYAVYGAYADLEMVEG
jgi:hypothetical protein